MSRIEVDNGYIRIDLSNSESYIKRSFEGDESLAVHEITFGSEKEAREAMDMLAEALCDKQLS